jgi:DNA-binding transcriptional regulator YhcF (GntR family)
MARKHDKSGRSKGREPYVGLPKFMLSSPAWRSLSHAARAAFIEAAAFYRGNNNGYLALAVRTIAERIGSSKDTASRALTELDDKGFIELTRMGTFTRKDRRASEYRLTMHACDRSHQKASHAYMHFIGSSDARSSKSDRTVRSVRVTKQSCRSQSDMKDQGSVKSPIDGPTEGTQVSYHREMLGGPPLTPVPSSTRLPKDDIPDLPHFLDRRVGRIGPN